MKTWMKVLLITLPVALVSLPLGQMLWAPASDGTHEEMAMSGLMLLGFIGVGVFEGLALGIGISFLVLGLPVVRRLAAATGSGALAWSAFASIIWFLVSWWPHDGLHRSMGDDMAALLAVEYAFHVTLIAAGAILAYAFVRAASRLLANGQSEPALAYRGARVQAISEV
ncbi:MAG TPA: hypothetical protein VND68_01590 [Chloroflexia bacterium]|nr:hypothetical protein [Chloroflexia bacterium]